MRQRIRLVGTLRVAGPALTVERIPVTQLGTRSALPNGLFIAAIEAAARDTVLVLNSDQQCEAALWGGLLAATAVQLGLGGVVADGPVRDPGEIVELGCPCFCSGTVSAGNAGLLALTSIGSRF